MSNENFKHHENRGKIYGRSGLYIERCQCDILLCKSTAPLSSKSYFFSKFARTLCTINPTGKCVLPKNEPNKICMCRVNKTLFLHIFEGKVGSMSQSQRHRWVQWHPHTPSLAKVNATVESNDVPCPLTVG